MLGADQGPGGFGEWGRGVSGWLAAKVQVIATGSSGSFGHSAVLVAGLLYIEISLVSDFFSFSPPFPNLISLHIIITAIKTEAD